MDCGHCPTKRRWTRGATGWLFLVLRAGRRMGTMEGDDQVRLGQDISLERWLRAKGARGR